MEKVRANEKEPITLAFNFKPYREAIARDIHQYPWKYAMRSQMARELFFSR